MANGAAQTAVSKVYNIAISTMVLKKIEVTISGSGDSIDDLIED